MLHCYMPRRSAQTGKTTSKGNQQGMPSRVQPRTPKPYRAAARRPTPPSLPCVTGPNRRERRGHGNRDQGSRQGERRRHTPGQRQEKKCMPGRRAGQQRVEERVKSDETTKETGSSQQPSKGRAQRRGHGKHTAGTTPQQSTGEGGTRGTDEGQHHTPRHAPHRHHTHRTHPHLRPQHVASGPQQPAQRPGSRGRGNA